MADVRSVSLPRLPDSNNNNNDDDDNNCSIIMDLDDSLHAHSRQSSGASTLSSPITPAFSNRSHSHSRWPSSTSSMTNPESPVNVAKSPLGDLVEDPSERDEDMSDLPAEPLCICDMTFCEHRRTSSQFRQSASFQPPTPDNDWTSVDDYFSDDIRSVHSSKRRKSGDHNPVETFTRRLSRRFPSISRRFRDQPAQPSTSVMPSATPSRSSSVHKRSSVRRSLKGQLEPSSSPVTPYFTPVDNQSEESVLTRPRASSRANLKGLEITLPEQAEDPFDRQELARTPLLPPTMDQHRRTSSLEELQSPLQSPSVADPGCSLAGTPSSTPVIPGYVTPPLSAKPSLTSCNPARPSTVLSLPADVPSMSLNNDADPWADRLGHANFHIYPEPYMPELCDSVACKRLLEDWETARREYLRQAVRVGDLHGPTSHIYKLTEQKWDEIDAEWRGLHERATAMAKASGEQLDSSKTLAKTQRGLSRMPSLNDPAKPSKFPRIDDADVVGPMVKYVDTCRRPSKKRTILRIFTDPASLLGQRTNITSLKRRF